MHFVVKLFYHLLSELIEFLLRGIIQYIPKLVELMKFKCQFEESFIILDFLSIAGSKDERKCPK